MKRLSFLIWDQAIRVRISAPRQKPSGFFGVPRGKGSGNGSFLWRKDWENRGFPRTVTPTSFRFLKYISMQYLKGAREQEAIGWMKEAAKVAENALCIKAKCGTVIVKGGEIIGSGYNAPPLDDVKNATCLDEYQVFDKPHFDRTCCMHAEWRAIIDALRNNPNKITGSKLYFSRTDKEKKGEIKKSGQPYCTVCSRLALDIGISHFLLWQEDGIAEYATDEYNKLSYEYHKTIQK